MKKSVLALMLLSFPLLLTQASSKLPSTNQVSATYYAYFVETSDGIIHEIETYECALHIISIYGGQILGYYQTPYIPLSCSTVEAAYN